jgi:hypothetical protein
LTWIKRAAMAHIDRQGRDIARSYNVDATTIGRLKS